jgi:hypothetical protein
MNKLIQAYTRWKWNRYLRKQKSENYITGTRADGIVKIIPKEITRLMEILFLKPTQKIPRLGICNTCDPEKKKFMNQLIDFEDEQCCFLLNHDIEPVSGIPWKETAEYKDQYGQELQFEALEKTEMRGELPL